MAGCYLEWFPYAKDRTMGLNHQMASLSCALGEAYLLQRTLLLPDRICLFGLHTQRWPGTAGPSADSCVPTDELFDIEVLSRLVPLQLAPSGADHNRSSTTQRAVGGAAHVAHVGQGWSSARVRQELPCGPATRLVRRRVDSFWFQQCARRHTDYGALAARLNVLVGAPPSASRPLNIILRSGLFFAPRIKAAAAAIRAAIGGPYASLHVRRSDKLTAKATSTVIAGRSVVVPAACNPQDCKTRDLLTRPDAIARSLLMWVPAQSHVYIGSTEPPAFFAPLRATFRLHFAEDFPAQLANITNNYALYAVETLLFFGSQASVESLSFQSSWFVDACFPAASMRGRRGGRLADARQQQLQWPLPPPQEQRQGGAARQPGPGGQDTNLSAINMQCRDATGVLVNDVLYGAACVSNAPCGKDMYLAPAPRPCGQPRLPERIMLSDRSAHRVALGRTGAPRRCAAIAYQAPAAMAPPPSSQADGRQRTGRAREARRADGRREGRAAWATARDSPRSARPETSHEVGAGHAQGKATAARAGARAASSRVAAKGGRAGGPKLMGGKLGGRQGSKPAGKLGGGGGSIGGNSDGHAMPA